MGSIATDGTLVTPLGTKGVAGDGPDTFNGVTDVVVATNGDIFVADGHVNSRIVKFSTRGRSSRRGGRRARGRASSTCRHVGDVVTGHTVRKLVKQ